MDIAFMTANYVAKEIQYSGADLLGEWGKCHQLTLKSFHGSQFEKKFESLIADIHQLGFQAIELWNAHLDPLLINNTVLENAKEILNKYNMKVIGLYTDVFHQPYTTEEAHTIFQTAKKLGASRIVQSGKPVDSAFIVELCNQYDIYFGIENHAEKTPEEVLEKIGVSAPRIGACIDTGWFATQGCNPIDAVKKLKDHIVHIHFKDITASGAHDTCALGDGIVNFQDLLAALKEGGYQGSLSIEHEPIDFDPTEDIKVSLTRLNQWLGESKNE